MSRKRKKTTQRYSVPAIHRALDLLETLAEEKRALTVTEVSRKFGIPKSSAYAILQTLKSRHSELLTSPTEFRTSMKSE